MARLCFIVGQIKEIEDARQEGLATQPDRGPPAMVRLLARVIGIGIETADMLVHEILSRNLRDRRAVARYAGLTGSPDESGAKRREKGLAKAGNARVRRGMVQLAWRFLLFQKDSALVLLSHEAEHLEAGPSRRKRPVSSMRPGDVLRRE
jgi:transposase